MKIISITVWLAAAGSIVAAPASEVTDLADVPDISNVVGISPANAPLTCTTTKKSGYVADAESIVRFLKADPKKENCVTRSVSGDGYKYAIYSVQGNQQFIGIVVNKNCSEVTVNCRTLATYLEHAIDVCKDLGRVAAIYYPHVDQYSYTNPKLCKKNPNNFAIAIGPPPPSSA